MKPTSLIYICVLLIISKICSANTTLTIAKPEQDYPPYHWLENGKVVGLLPEILSEAIKTSHLNKIEYTNVPWNRMLQLALSGGVDAIFPLMMTRDRAEFIDFVQEPLIEELFGFYSLKDNAPSIKRTADLKGLKIGIVSGYQYTNEINSLNLNMVQAPNEVVQVKMLLAERVDVILIDQNVIRYYQTLKSDNDYKQLHLLPIKIAKNPLYIGFSKARNLNKNVDEITRGLRMLKSSGKYHTIVNKYAQFTLSTK